MATLINTAISTSTEAPNTDELAEKSYGNGQMDGRSTRRQLTGDASKKYKHLYAIHASQKTSCLSRDSDTTPSFVGFKNLMVLVLGMANVVN